MYHKTKLTMILKVILRFGANWFGSGNMLLPLCVNELTQEIL